MIDWHLDAISWDGVTPGASHYYGILRDDDFEGRHEVTRVLDAAGGASLSRYDEFPWKAGDETGRFESKEELVAAALVLFGEVAAPGETLWDRSSIYVEREILAIKEGV